MKKAIPIGISDFKELIKSNNYFVDKTDFIRQVVEEGSKITMLPRPRRFGKTLNLSMLRYFFEKDEGHSNRELFQGMSIEGWEGFDRHQGKYPVVMLTLKDCKGATFEQTLAQFSFELQKEYIRHDYLLKNKAMNVGQRLAYEHILNWTASEEEMGNALDLLVSLLAAHYGEPAVVLLDEYDSPVHVAFDRGYYQRMIDFIRVFMGRVFEDNPLVLRGVITGILRVSKESLFSGLNNIDVNNLLTVTMSTSFGFTQEETDRLLADYGMSSYREEVKMWYNGYLFGAETEIYNPWSLLNFIKQRGQFAAYWVNTGSDTLLRQIIGGGPSLIRKELEILLTGGSIRCVVNDKIAFPDLLFTRANVWSFMLFVGYLKAGDRQRTVLDTFEYTLSVPNREIATVYRDVVRGWINESPVKNDQVEMMLEALLESDIRAFERLLNEFVVRTLSYYDTSGTEPEKVYQAFLLGLLVNLSAYEVTSNRESGFGRYDILLRPRDLRNRGYIMELKVCESDFGDTVEETLDSALAQIEKKQYEATLRQAGVSDILKMAITFDGKRVWIKKQ